MSEDMVKTDYEQMCKEYEYKIEELSRRNDELQKVVKEKEYHIENMAKEIARLEGRIEGLEFSIICNGVSGGEMIK